MSSLQLRLEKLKAAQPLTGTFLLFDTPDKGRGVGCSGTAILLTEPVQFGKELALTKEPLWVGFGRIGTAGAKCCLKTIAKCDTESHERTKCTIPEHSSFFIQLHRSNKGHANTVLDAKNLDLLLVKELLEKEGLNWSSEFETMRVQGTQTLEDSEVSNSLLKTAKKVSRKTLEEAMEDALSSLGTIGVSEKLEDSFARLGGIQDIIKTMASVNFDDAGEKITPRDPRFEEESYAKFCEDVYDRIAILS
jgi:hypothetical protein